MAYARRPHVAYVIAIEARAASAPQGDNTIVCLKGLKARPPKACPTRATAWHCGRGHAPAKSWHIKASLLPRSPSGLLKT